MNRGIADYRDPRRRASDTSARGLLRSRERGRSGFTLVEALIATALLGFSLVVMFGFHSQAVRSNRDARRMTACTYLAQAQVERLMALPWSLSSRHADLADSMTDPTTAADKWAFLEMPNAGAKPTQPDDDIARDPREASDDVERVVHRMGSKVFSRSLGELPRERREYAV